MTLPRVTSADPKLLLTVGEACKILNVCPNTMRVWSDKGLIPSYRIGQRRDRRFLTQDILDFLEGVGEGMERRVPLGTPGA